MECGSGYHIPRVSNIDSNITVYILPELLPGDLIQLLLLLAVLDIIGWGPPFLVTTISN